MLWLAVEKLARRPGWQGGAWLLGGVQARLRACVARLVGWQALLAAQNNRCWGALVDGWGWGVWGAPGNPAGVAGGLSSVEWWFAVMLGLTEAAFRNVGDGHVPHFAKILFLDKITV